MLQVIIHNLKYYLLYMQFVFILISFVPVNIFSQLNYNVTKYDKKQGLSTETFQTTTTADGKIWLATSEGIVAYNGHTFINYTHQLTDSNSLSNNYCRAMTVDGNNNLWVIADDFLNIFNTKTKKVKRVNEAYSNYTNTRIKLITNCIFYSKQNNIIYVGTKQGLFFSKNGSTALSHIGTVHKQLNFNADIRSVIFDDNTNTLLFISNHVLYSFNLNTNVLIKTELEKTIINLKLKPNEMYISAMYAVGNTIWLGVYGKGLLEFNSITQQSKLYVNKVSTANNITAIVPYNNGKTSNKLYISTHGSGIVIFDCNNKLIDNAEIVMRSTMSSFHNLSYNEKQNIMWGCGFGGLLKIDLNNKQLKVFEFNPIKNKEVNIHPDKIQVERNNLNKDELLWVLVHYVGTYRYDLKAKKVLEIPNLAKQFFVHEASILDYIIDKNNCLWVSSVRDGITCYDITKNKIIFQDKQIAKTTLSWITQFFEDNQSNIWYATANGVFKFNKGLNKISAEVEFNNFLAKNNLSLYIEGITNDEKGNMWVSVDGDDDNKKAAIVKYNTVSKKAIEMFNENKDINASNDPILLRNLTITKKNELFALIRGYGLIYFKDANVPKFELITKQNTAIADLYSDIIIADTMSNVWLAAQKNLFYYNQKNRNFVNVFLDNEKWKNKVIYNINKSKNTESFFISGEQSILELPALKLTDGISNSNLVFEQFKVFDQLINDQIINGQTIQLAHTQNTISISFALLNYSNNEQNKYYWKLSGVNKEWQTSNQNFAVYNLLPPGKYVFEVKATDDNGFGAAQQLKLIIIIKPPFYKTWWFISLLTLALFSLVYFLYKQRIEKIKNKYTFQNKIAADLHDEVGSTLTSISILSKLSHNMIDTVPEKAKEMLSKINVQSTTVQQNISDIVWSIRADNKNGSSLITRFREYATNTLEPLNINVEFSLQDNMLEKEFSIEAKKELLLIFKESINNIVKHANASKVKVSLYQFGNKNILSIQDNGIWQGANSGTGSKSIAERAKALNGFATITQNEIGTLVTITF